MKWIESKSKNKTLEEETKRSTIDDLKFEISYTKKGSPGFTRIIVFFRRALPRNWPRALMRPKPQGHASHFKFPAVPCEFLIRVGSTNDRGRSIDSSREMIGEL